ncbi:hypothetical protein LEP1GSC052_1596 [Leptospira kmetyi serovar Malaysia str. Bejo-Iso9]|nr:hypothetical protein LEP1GSC052_1596 [Leptospira kmetyi serovar Malaysia str. Bejo-Iso9]
MFFCLFLLKTENRRNPLRKTAKKLFVSLLPIRRRLDKK